jgi:1-acyl-sn-glycerol-3-phosphate acyltransferase
MTLRALGIRLDMRGTPRSGPGLVVGNHVSWLDILALTASAPMRQVAKSEVASWPIIGTMARRSGAIFVRRDSWRQLPAMVEEMTTALRQGEKVQVFPEATTRCGGAIAEFRRPPSRPRSMPGSWCCR